mmetsp:Transcript_19722/g.43011  ORF Transcript_19722/g.43011 Transcript_19722/m.43011 type:complete len:2026 (+) Transcript_19722:197-6274(+)
MTKSVPIAAAMEIDHPQQPAAAPAASTKQRQHQPRQQPQQQPAKSNPFADEVERIVQSAEARELSACDNDGTGTSNAAAATTMAAATSPAGPSRTGGPLTAGEIDRLSVLCASLESSAASAAATSGGGSGNAAKSSAGASAPSAATSIQRADADVVSNGRGGGDLHVTKRIAKDFDGVLYLGTVTGFVSSLDDDDDNNAAAAAAAPASGGMWHVRYDDGDEEDYDRTDLDKALALYDAQGRAVDRVKTATSTTAGAAAAAAAASVATPSPPPPRTNLTDAEAAPSAAPADGDVSDASSDYCPTLQGWASVDGDVLAQLIPMLERHVRSAGGVDLIAEARAVSEASSGSDSCKKSRKGGGNVGGGGGGEGADETDENDDNASTGRGKAKNTPTVDQWISNAGNCTPHGISYPGSGYHRLELIRRGLEAASILLAIVTSRGIDQRAISEDAIESCISFLRQHLIRNVIPSISASGHVAASSTHSAGAADSHITPRKGKRAKTAEAVAKPNAGGGGGKKRKQQNAAQQLIRDLKKVYKPILTTVGLLSMVMERVELLVRTIQLEDQQLMSICSAALSTMALDPAPSPQTNAVHAHVIQIASISLVTAIFRRYPRHRTIVIEDLFPLMLNMPSSKKNLRTYATKSVANLRTIELMESANGVGGAIALKSPVPASSSRRRSSSGSATGTIDQQGHIQMMSALFLHLVQACVAMPVAIAPKLDGEGDDDDDDDDKDAEARPVASGSWDMPRLTPGTVDCDSVVNMFVNEFAKRCAKKGEEGGASEFRPILSNLVEDLLQVRFDPEFPASDMLLHEFCRKLTQDLLRCSSIVTERSHRATAESTYLATAFTILGMICSSIGANLRCHRENPLVLPEATDVDYDAELVIEKNDVKCFCGRSNLTDVFMVDCDRCHGWFHGSCVNITKENAPSSWKCDDCTLQVIVMEESKEFAARSERRKRSSSEMTGGSGTNDQAPSSTDIGDIYIMRQLLLNFLATTKSPMTRAAREFHLAKWIQECEELRGSSDTDKVIDAEVKEATYLDVWHVPSNEHNEEISEKRYLSDEGNGKLMEALAAVKSGLATSFPRLLGVIIGLMGDEDSTVLRKLAVKTVSQIIQVDSKLMLRKEVSKAVAQRFRDEAISVREASVSLVGSFVLQSPSAASGFHPLLLEKLHDEGVSVRKRAVKIFRDLMLTTPDYPGRAAACSVMLQRAADPKEDDGVRDLIHETFQALWFDTAKVNLAADEGDNSKQSRRRNKKVLSASELRLVSASSQMVEVVAWSNGRSESLGNLVKELLFGFGEGNKVSKAAAVKRRHEAAQFHCSKIVSALIEQLLAFEDVRAGLDKKRAGRNLVALLATLEVFGKSSPSLLIEHLDTILPYLKGENNVSREDEAAIAASVSKIISRCSPLLSAVDAERLSGVIVSDLGNVINRLGSNAMSAAIEALSKLASHPHAGSLPESKLIALARGFYSFLYRARDANVSKLNTSARSMVHRALSALGSICRFHDFGEDSSVDVDLTNDSSSVPDPSEIELDWSNIVSSSYAMFSLYLQKEHPPTRCQALRAMNGIFIAQPRLMLAVEQTGLLADVMSEKSGREQQLAALQCWRELLLCEEKRVESGEAREQMEAKHITLSKRISGDQDEDASLVGGVMSQHSNRFYQMLMSRDVRVRAGCLDLIGDLLRQGLINPIQTIPFLLALQGDVGAPDIRGKALKLLVAEGEKRPDSLRQRVKLGCKEAFNFQRKVYPDKPTTAVIERKAAGTRKVECIFDKVFIESIRSSKVNRHGLFMSLLSLFELDVDSDTKEKKNLGRARKLLHLQAFAAQVLATLPYNNASDPLFIVYHCNARLADAEMIAEKMADFLRPYGLAAEDMYDILDDDEDAIEEAAKMKVPSKSKDLAVMTDSDFDLETFADLCSSVSTTVLLLKLRSHLKGAFNLSDARMKEYIPGEKDRISDKGHTSSATNVFSIEPYVSGGSKLDECILRYAGWKKAVRAFHEEEAESAKKHQQEIRKRSSSSGAEDASEEEEMDEDEEM